MVRLARGAVAALALALSVGSLAPAPARAATGAIQDDYPRALAEARARRVPMVIEVWAPW